MSQVQCLDFAAMECPIGLLVRRNNHYQQDQCVRRKSQVGVVVDYRVFPGDDKEAEVWPIIAWEGESTGPSLTNPALVDILRRNDKQRAVYVVHQQKLV